jgi:acyl-CoA synthetase (NDP forming)
MKPPTGGSGRVAVLTLSGGAGIVATDFVAERGLAMATLSAPTRRSLATLFPEWMPVTNPVDLWPAVERQTGNDPDVVGRSLAALLGDPGVDAIFFHAFVSSPRSRPNIAELSSRLRSAGKPLVAWVIGRRDDVYAFQKEALVHGIPVFTEISRATECLAAILCQKRRPGTERLLPAPLSTRPVLPPPEEDHCQEERTGGDGRVGHVEGGPVVDADINVEKIDHLAEADSVDEITHRPGNDQGKRYDQR